MASTDFLARDECVSALLDALTDYEEGEVDLGGGLSLKREELAKRGCDADTLVQHNLLRIAGLNSYADPEPILRLAIDAQASHSGPDLFASNVRPHFSTQTLPRATISPGLQAQQRKGLKRSRATEEVTSAGPLEGATPAPGVTNTQQDLAQPDGASLSFARCQVVLSDSGSGRGLRRDFRRTVQVHARTRRRSRA